MNYSKKTIVFSVINPDPNCKENIFYHVLMPYGYDFSPLMKFIINRHFSVYSIKNFLTKK